MPAMAIEAEAIPYAPAVLRGERLLVLAPHPDDEVIGCGGLLAQHLREGRAARVIVVTDGAEAGNREQREAESARGLARLGTVVPEFLRYPDRHLAEHAEDLLLRLASILREQKPDLIAVPSPIEIHPDHLALSRAFCELLQRDELLHAELATARVAFYEVGQPLRPNTIVDITAVADDKYAAIAEHASQAQFRDYVSYSRGLNAYRAMTLPPEVKFAEAYWVTPIQALRTTPFSALQSAAGDARSIEVTRETLHISVIVRTKDRPALLQQAVDSIRAGGYPAQIVVVNDGGVTPDIRDVTLVDHEESRGRSEAMNSGARMAGSPFLAFLDDDDLYYPEHLPALAAAAAATPERSAWYSDAVSAFMRIGPSGGYETHSRLRLFGSDFDRDLLLVDNYIPLPTILVPREAYFDAGGFDPDFDLFEDWDFLIRLSKRGSFVHVPRITCEIRHIEGAGSITLESPEGSARFREAKLAVWRKHDELIDRDVIANAFERQKRRITGLLAEATEARGLQHHLQVDAARLERDKTTLIGEIQTMHAEIAKAQEAIAKLHGGNEALHLSNEQLHRELEKVQRENERITHDGHLLTTQIDDLRGAFDESQRTIGALYAEIGRLQGILDSIYQSRTWKLHTMVQKLKGAG